MGCCLPKALQFDAAQRAEVIDRFSAARETLLMTEEELWRVHQAFVEGNISDSGIMSKEEFHKFLKIPISPMSNRMFSIYEDGPDGMCFKTFLTACWSICSRDAENLYNFAFQMYDIKGRGELGLADIDLLMTELFGVDFITEHHTAQQLYKKVVRVDYKGRALDAHVDLEQFAKLGKSNPILCHPAFKVQHALQELTLGEHGWEVVTRRRDKAVKEGAFDVGAIIALANEQRTKSGSMVPMDARHVVPFRAAMGAQKSIMDFLPGLKTSTKVKPEDDYKEVKEKVDEVLRHKARQERRGKEMEAAQKAAVEQTQKLMADLREDPKEVMRRASIAAAAGAVAALGLAKVAGTAALDGAGAAVETAVNAVNAKLNNSRDLKKKVEVKNLDINPTLDENDPAMKALNAYKARRASQADGVGAGVLAAERRASALNKKGHTGKNIIKLEKRQYSDDDDVTPQTTRSRTRTRSEVGDDGSVVPGYVSGGGEIVVSPNSAAARKGGLDANGQVISTTQALRMLPTIQAGDADDAAGPRIGSDAPEGKLPQGPRRESQAGTPTEPRMPKVRRKSEAKESPSPAQIAEQKRRQSQLMAKAIRRASQVN